MGQLLSPFDDAIAITQHRMGGLLDGRDLVLG
jgi:hypothetical protein